VSKITILLSFITSEMPKESLYCIPYDKKMTRKDGFVYHCERAKIPNAVKNNEPPKCPKCNKVFKDDRCLKIHMTKMKHWLQQQSPCPTPVAPKGSSKNTSSSSKSSQAAKRRRSSSSEKNGQKWLKIVLNQ